MFKSGKKYIKVVQINGKTRDIIKVKKDQTIDEIKDKVLINSNVAVKVTLHIMLYVNICGLNFSESMAGSCTIECSAIGRLPKGPD